MNMCTLQEQIKQLITSNNNLLAYNQEWKNYDYSKLKAKHLNVTIVERKNIQDVSQHYKFIEYTKWENTATNDLCVAIGFNPATYNQNEIDGTNIKLINALKDKYESCILLNLYPQVSTVKEKFNESDDEDSKFHNTLLQILDFIIEKNIRTVIFWGRTVSVNKDIFEKLQKMQKKNNLLMTVKKGTSSHYHPARVDIEIKVVSMDHLKDSYTLI